MPGRPHTYSDKQRAAIVQRINDQGATAVQAVAEAKAGQLEGLAPFAPSKAAAERWATEAKRNGGGLPNREALEAAALRLWRLHLTSLDELEAVGAKRKRTDQEQRGLDMGTLAAIKRQRELEHLLTKPTTPKRKESNEATEARSVAERLASKPSETTEVSGVNGDAGHVLVNG